jgi:hypothetical protein
MTLIHVVKFFAASLLAAACEGKPIDPIPIAEQFAVAIGEPFIRSGASFREIRGGSYQVNTPTAIYFVDRQGIRVTAYASLTALDRIRTQSPNAARPYEDEVKAWQKANAFSILSPLAESMRPFAFKNFGTRVASSSNNGQVRLMYEVKAHGIWTRAVGNSRTIVLDSLTGKIVSFKEITSYTYLAPDVRISEQQAIEKAKAVLRAKVSRADVSAPRANKGYLMTSGEFGSGRGAELKAARQLSYGFMVSFKKSFGVYVVLIEGKTGDCLGGGLYK